jgi:hypothetical protein
MALYARSRPGTTPSFWRGYHNAQLKVASSCMRSAATGVVREASIQELIADFEKEDTGCCSFCQRGVIATTLPSRRAFISRIGGRPKNRLYSRLNWLGLS